MKSITYLIILSVVWSIISGILEKKKAKAKKNAAKVGLESGSVSVETFTEDPVTVLVESLRRKKRVQKQPEVVSPQKRSGDESHRIKGLKPLHVADCPVPQKAQAKRRLSAASQLGTMLQNRHNVRTAIVLA
ncbi:MAG TPA: hypothetical protein EYN11_03985, partial [Phycisphaerales bacterium]|nr:hypothetical protein [Phycisphaerales bacterium]